MSVALVAKKAMQISLFDIPIETVTPDTSEDAPADDNATYVVWRNFNGVWRYTGQVGSLKSIDLTKQNSAQFPAKAFLQGVDPNKLGKLTEPVAIELHPVLDRTLRSNPKTTAVSAAWVEWLQFAIASYVLVVFQNLEKERRLEWLKASLAFYNEKFEHFEHLSTDLSRSALVLMHEHEALRMFEKTREIEQQIQLLEES